MQANHRDRPLVKCPRCSSSSLRRSRLRLIDILRLRGRRLEDAHPLVESASAVYRDAGMDRTDVSSRGLLDMGNPKGSVRFLLMLRDSGQGRARSMIVIGARLRAIRQQWRLSLLEVEQRSRRIAREHGELSYRVSASWLARLKSGEHELTVNKLIALAEIYGTPN
jgi:Helix-turn-helix domain